MYEIRKDLFKELEISITEHIIKLLEENPLISLDNTTLKSGELCLCSSNFDNKKKSKNEYYYWVSDENVWFKNNLISFYISVDKNYTYQVATLYKGKQFYFITDNNKLIRIYDNAKGEYKKRKREQLQNESEVSDNVR